jgi:SAM-dependent methyltransferase
MLLDRKTLHTIRRRRAELRAAFDISRQLAALEESMVPAYCHANPLAAGVSWWRLLAARELAGAVKERGPLLDFGAGSGELYHLLDAPKGYHFVEPNPLVAGQLERAAPSARRLRLDELPPAGFGTIFALDALEHDTQPETTAARLAAALAPGGLLIVSGPTESALYRLGRRIAGFRGHYHRRSVYDVERILAARLRRRARTDVPPLLALFRLSAWDNL